MGFCTIDGHECDCIVPCQQGNAAANAKLSRFLALVWTAQWLSPPPVWNEQFRQSMNEGLVSVGFGGVLKLTEAGENAVRASA